MDEVFCYAGDIAGYKNILLSLPPDEQQNRIHEFKDLVTRAAQKYGFMDSFIIVSDAIFVIAKNSKDDLRNLLKFSRDILDKGIGKSLPIRAAIDFGIAKIDRDSHMIYGKAAANAYILAEQQDWIGTCCAENPEKECCRKEERCLEDDRHPIQPKLPYISELWDYDLAFVYPVPMKSGKVLFRPVISWNVPPYRDLRSWTVSQGLVSDVNMDWTYAKRIQNTIIFSHYLNAAKYGLVPGNPDKFHGDSPIGYVDQVFNKYLSEIRFLKGNWSIVKIPGRELSPIPANGLEELITALQNILKDEMTKKA